MHQRMLLYVAVIWCPCALLLLLLLLLLLPFDGTLNL
jgi:hypothetical protein